MALVISYTDSFQPVLFTQFEFIFGWLKLGAKLPILVGLPSETADMFSSASHRIPSAAVLGFITHQDRYEMDGI